MTQRSLQNRSGWCGKLGSIGAPHIDLRSEIPCFVRDKHVSFKNLLVKLDFSKVVNVNRTNRGACLQCLTGSVLWSCDLCLQLSRCDDVAFFSLSCPAML